MKKKCLLSTWGDVRYTKGPQGLSSNIFMYKRTPEGIRDFINKIGTFICFPLEHTNRWVPYYGLGSTQILGTYK
jgi:hypothetical protein